MSIVSDLNIVVGYGLSSYANLLDDVQTFEVTNGRQFLTDPYEPSKLRITCRNPSAWSPVPKNGWQITLSSDSPSFFSGWITDVTVTYGKVAAEDTATITAEGAFSRVTRRNVNGLVLAQGTMDTQITTLMTNLGISPYSLEVGYSVASAQTFTGNAGDFVNTLLATEVGRLSQQYGELSFLARESLKVASTLEFSDTPADWTTKIKYDYLRFRSSSENFYTRVRISPLGLASQVESTGSAPFIELQQDSYDYTTTQADSHASYLLGKFSSRDVMVTEIGFTLLGQNNSTTRGYVQNVLDDETQINRDMTVKFRGTTYYGIVEGFECSGDAEDISVRLYLSSQDLNSYLRWTSPAPYNAWDNNKWGF